MSAAVKLEDVRVTLGEDFSEIRASVRRICANFPGAYWRDLETHGAYPAEFESVAAASQVLGEAVHRHGALVERGPAPGALRRVGPGDGRLDLARRSRREAREDVPGRGVDGFEQVGHASSLSLIQSAIAGRYLYVMLLQTWFPSGYRSRVALGASRAIRSACSGLTTSAAARE